MRIDAHQHFWRLTARNGAWPPPQLASIHRDFEPHDLQPLLDACGIGGTVVVQSLPSQEDTRFLLGLADTYSFIRAVVGWVDLKAGDAPASIAALAVHPRLRGLRPMLQDLHDERWIDDRRLAPAVEAMLAHRLVLDALVLPRHLPALFAFAERNPALPIVIDHLAKPEMHGLPPASWRADMARLASLPQVYCKLSGMVTEAGMDWTISCMRPYVDYILDAFGPERVIWGSDWPVLRLAADYSAWMTASEAMLACLDAPQRQAIFGLNSIRVYRLDVDGG